MNPSEHTREKTKRGGGATIYLESSVLASLTVLRIAECHHLIGALSKNYTPHTPSSITRYREYVQTTTETPFHTNTPTHPHTPTGSMEWERKRRRKKEVESQSLTGWIHKERSSANVVIILEKVKLPSFSPCSVPCVPCVPCPHMSLGGACTLHTQSNWLTH